MELSVKTVCFLIETFFANYVNDECHKTFLYFI